MSWYWGRRLVTRLALLAMVAVTSTVVVSRTHEAKAQTEPSIRHSALQCVPNNQFPRCSAVIEPGEEIRVARVYFRSDKYPDFYYVDMVRNADSFEAILPKPAEETERVLYYIEAITQSFASARTEEHAPQVSSDSDCRRRDPAALWFTGENPGIVVGAIASNVASFPPGFQTAGITGFISAAGAASGAGGGAGAGTWVVLGAAAGGAGAAAIAAGGEDNSGGGPPEGTSTTSTTSIPAATTTTTTPTSAVNEPPSACFTIDPPEAKVLVGETVKLDARCSKGDRSGDGDPISFYDWDLGDGRTRSGPFITPSWSVPGVYTVKLTVTDSGGVTASAGEKTLVGASHMTVARQVTLLQDSVSKPVTVEAAPVAQVTACFEAKALTPGFSPECDYEFDASCSTGTIARYEWILDTTGVFKPGPIPKSGKIVTYQWTGCGYSTPTPVGVQLTVIAPDGAADSVSQSVGITYLTNPFLRDTQVPSSFVSYLGSPPFDGSVEGQVLINGSQAETATSAAPHQHRIAGRFGENTIEAWLVTPAQPSGFWRFDFTSANGFVPGSIKVHSGEVVSADAYTVTFRLAGGPGERLRFAFQLLP